MPITVERECSVDDSLMLAVPAGPLSLSLDVGVVADLDEARMRQVVENLIGNGLKYSPRGATVFVSVRGLVGAARPGHTTLSVLG